MQNSRQLPALLPAPAQRAAVAMTYERIRICTSVFAEPSYKWQDEHVIMESNFRDSPALQECNPALNMHSGVEVGGDRECETSLGYRKTSPLNKTKQGNAKCLCGVHASSAGWTHSILLSQLSSARFKTFLGLS